MVQQGRFKRNRICVIQVKFHYVTRKTDEEKMVLEDSRKGEHRAVLLLSVYFSIKAGK